MNKQAILLLMVQHPTNAALHMLVVRPLTRNVTCGHESHHCKRCRGSRFARLVSLRELINPPRSRRQLLRRDVFKGPRDRRVDLLFLFGTLGGVSYSWVEKDQDDENQQSNRKRERRQMLRDVMN